MGNTKKKGSDEQLLNGNRRESVTNILYNQNIINKGQQLTVPSGMAVKLKSKDHGSGSSNSSDSQKPRNKTPVLIKERSIL